MGGLSINGGPALQFPYDGVTNKDTGSNSGNYAAPALDSIAEVAGADLELPGRVRPSSGATITVITRSGSRTSAAARRITSATMRGMATSSAAGAIAAAA